MINSQMKTVWLRRGKLLFLCAASAFALCVFVAGVKYAVQNMGRVPGSGGTATTSVPEVSTTGTALPALSGSADFLLCCANMPDNIIFALLLRADFAGRLFTVSALDPSFICAVGGDLRDLNGHYAAGGAARLVKAVETGAGVKIERYILSSAINFTKIIKTLGEVEVYVEDNISYTEGDVSLNLEKGLQLLDYNDLLSYMRYGAQGRALLRLQAETVCCIFDAFFTPDNLTARGEQLFGSLINLVDSDINAYDFISRQTDLKNLLLPGVDVISGGIFNWGVD